MGWSKHYQNFHRNAIDSLKVTKLLENSIPQKTLFRSIEYKLRIFIIVNYGKSDSQYAFVRKIFERPHYKPKNSMKIQYPKSLK